MVYLLSIFGVVLLLAIVFTVFGHFVSKKFSDLDADAIHDLVIQLNERGYDYETLNFGESSGDSFLQFKKYIYSDGRFGVDAVIPLVGRYEDLLPSLQELKHQYGLHLELIETPQGWSFAFLQVSAESKIQKQIIGAVIDLVGLNGQEGIHVTENSTFAIMRKGEVFGKAVGMGSQETRYLMVPKA